MIKKGKVELFLGINSQVQKQTIVKTLQKGEYFGEKSFFDENSKHLSARSVGYIYINR